MPARRRPALLAAVLAVVALAGCAGDPEGGGPEGGGAAPGGDGGARPQRPLPNVFISPAGEPFRAVSGAPYPSATWFGRADTDGDGLLSRAEFRADALRFFDRLDANHDGVLDGLEVQDYESRVAPEILPHIEDLQAYEGMDTGLSFDDPSNTETRRNERRGGGGGGRGGRAPTPTGVGVQGAAVYSMLNMPEPVAAADALFDGRITRAEFAAAADRRFDILDKAGAGRLALATLPKTPVQLAIQARARSQAKGRGQHRPAALPP